MGSVGGVPVTDQLPAGVPPGVGPPRSWLSLVTLLVARFSAWTRRPRPTVLGNSPRDFHTQGTRSLLLTSSPALPWSLWGLVGVAGRGAGAPRGMRPAPRSPARTGAVGCVMDCRATRRVLHRAVTKRMRP